MKNQFTSRIVKFTFAFMFILIASSCNEDNDAMDAAALAKENNSEIAAKGGKVSTAVAESFNVPNEICAGLAAEFCFTAAVGTNLQVQQLIAGEWVQVYQISQSTLNPQCFPLTFATAGTFQLRYKIGSGGFLPNNNGMTVTAINCTTCDDANFTYETSDNQNIVFTYNHNEEVSNVTIEFTFPQVMISELNNDGKYVAADGKLYDVNNATNQTVFTWTGEVSCNSDEAETFEFSFAPDCNAGNANDGQANIWTDAKIVAINGVALVDDLLTIEDESEINLKEINNLSNIVYTGCPKKN